MILHFVQASCRKDTKKMHMLQKMLDFSGFYAKNSDGVEIVLHAIAAISGDV